MVKYFAEACTEIKLVIYSVCRNVFFSLSLSLSIFHSILLFHQNGNQFKETWCRLNINGLEKITPCIYLSKPGKSQFVTEHSQLLSISLNEKLFRHVRKRRAGSV